MRFSIRMMLLATMLLAFAGCNSNAAPPPLIVGHVADKTRLDKAGDQAELGIRLALYDVNKDGALAETFGGRKIVVQHTNTMGESDAFESEAVRLVSVNRAVALLGGRSAKEVTALDHVKVPILTFHGQPVPGASNQVFYLGMMPTRQGEVLAKVVDKKPVGGRIVILQDERRSDRIAAAEAFEKAIYAAHQDFFGQPMIATMRFGKEPNWTEILDRMQRPAPQTVVFAGAVADFNAWLRAARKYLTLENLQIVFAGNDGEQRLFDLDDDGKTAIHFATAFHADPASDKIQAFLKAFRAMPPKTEADVNAALAYDGMRMLVAAMKEAGPPVTPERIREELAKTKDFDGLTGPLKITDERQVQRPLFVMHWQHGTLTFVKAFP